MSFTDASLSFDVAVLGGGLAGSLIARQLRRAHPDLRIGVFEKASERSFKVGESTVEMASHYLIKRLGLSRYMYENQLPKNGLRFFFDNPERNAELESMSEIGSVALPYIPSFQIDRARMEEDLLEMNRAAGIAVHCPAKVSRLRLSPDGGPHRFEATVGERRREVECRWLVDASGRASLVSKQKKLRVEEDHPLAAVWGRFRHVRDLDDIGSPTFSARVKHTSRHLSTTHFSYPGYWIWFIPLGRGIVSVGVVIRKSQWKDEWRTEEGFWAFLREHASSAKLLEGAELIDVMSYGQLAYGTTRFYDAAERWGMIGEAAAFSDPLYSPGSDYIAMGNDFVCDLIRRDLAGEDGASIAKRGDLYDRFMQFRFETTMLLYKNLYGALGSFELWSLKWDFDIAGYYNLWVEPFMLNRHLDAEYLESQLRQKKLVIGLMKNFGALFERVERHLLETGNFYRKNLGSFQGDFPTMECQVVLGSEESAAHALERTAEAFNLTRRRALALLGRPDEAAHAAALPITYFLAGKPLVPELDGDPKRARPAEKSAKLTA